MFSEKEIWSIANEIIPAITSSKRVERTHTIYNNFISSIQERVHIVISLESCLSADKLAHILQEHSLLFTEFYLDFYKPLKLETINSIARYYLALQNEEAKVRRFNKKYNSHFNNNNEKMIANINNNDEEDEEEDENLTLNEIHTFSTIMTDLHLIASETYLNIYNTNKKLNNKLFMSKPFSVSIFKQIALYFKIYMKRIKENEQMKIEKFEKTFAKINQVSDKLKNLDNEREEYETKLKSFEKQLSEWDEMINKQKDMYKVVIDECRKEEKLVDEMSKALEKLRADVTNETQDYKNLISPQYEMAMKAIESIDATQLNELKSYRSPPQRVLAVVNTLCLMFREPPGWESGKLLLMRKGFFDDLIYYDKKNIPDDIFNALEQICAVETFTPECVKPGSVVAASFCEWILAIFNFAKFERTITNKSSDLVQFEKLYNERLATLGEKKLNSEKKCQVLEKYCEKRLEVLKEMKRLRIKLDNFQENEKKAKNLLQLIEDDKKIWTKQYNNSLILIKTYKVDALATSSYICYAGIFDMESRSKIMKKWITHLNKLNKLSKFQLNNEKSEKNQSNKYCIRSNFNINDILINSNDYKSLLVELNKQGLKDEFLVSNALILREYCSLPSTTHWPQVYDPDGYSIKILSLLQDSINTIKNNLNNEYLNSSPIMSGLLKNTDSFAPKENNNVLGDELESIAVEHPSVNPTATLFHHTADQSTLDLNYHKVESLPSSYSLSSSRLSAYNQKSIISRMSGRASSIWETSTFYTQSGTQTVATFYQSKSGKNFLVSLNSSSDFNENDLKVPVIETDLNVLPKDNLCILDSKDPELDYKLINAAVHGVSVYLKNSERFQITNRITELIMTHDFLVDSATDKEYLKIGEEEIIISPSFKLILQVSTPITLNYGGKNNNLFDRLTKQANSSHFVIDFSISNNFITNDILTCVLDYERPGYFNQLLFADKILHEADNNLYNRQVH